MPPIHLLQCNNWQPQPKISGSFRGPSPGNVKSPSTIFMKGRTTTVTTDPVSSPTVTNEPQSTPGSLKPANIANVTSNVKGPGLCELIISRIQTGSDGPELEVFSNVSEEDYAYVLDAINSDCTVVWKPSYNHHLQELIVTLPSAIHETVCWEVLQCPEEDKVKVQGMRSEYDQGFSLKDKSKRFYENRD
ncbi:hypothetical protein BDR07DRAFT_1496099 [Suillus spraguei]|nr:hypothetical protein BDR07DRAFT_1496099 [Suillus spraguei]